MRVGIFIDKISPQAGGGYTFQWDLLDSFLKLREESPHSFSIFVPRSQLNELGGLIPSDTLKVIPYYFPRALAILGNMARRFKIYYLDKIGTIDHLAAKNHIEFVWFLTPAFYPLDIPYLTVVWDLQHRRQPWFPEVSAGIEWQNRETVYATVLRRASAIITGNQSGKEEIERFYGVPPERIHLLPHPTPKFNLTGPKVEKDILEHYPGLKAGQYLLYPAQFWPHKNHANLLLALRHLKNQYNIELPVVFVGSDKGNESYIRDLVKRLNLKNQTFFLGFVTNDDLATLYRNAFALLYMTFFGPENLPPLEAFSFGCPVIASNVAGAKEQMGDAALFADPKNPAEIADAIRKLYENPQLRQELKNAGKQRVEKWAGVDFVRGVLKILDDFEAIRRCWK